MLDFSRQHRQEVKVWVDMSTRIFQGLINKRDRCKSMGEGEIKVRELPHKKSIV